MDTSKTFHDFKVAVSEQFSSIQNLTLFSSNATKDALWDTYLGAFPEGTNPIHKERTHYDCNCCKQFIRAAGNVLAIKDDQLVSIWDINIGGHFQAVADAMSALTKAEGINSLFLHSEGSAGTNFNMAEEDGKAIKWEHFHQVLPRSVVVTDGSIGTKKGNSKSNFSVLKRSLNEITKDSIDVVLELIAQGSLYRGEEHVSTIRALLKAKANYIVASDQELFLWGESVKLGRNGGFRNTVIGTLLTDLSEGVELEVAVKKFEVKVAPQNYKRPTALVTQGMINKAQEKVAELGIEDALPRRFAVIEDVTIANVLFADRTAKKAMGVFDVMTKEATGKLPNLDKIEEVTIDTFLSTILPKADSLEVLVDNKHTNNFVSLIAPINKEANSILKWGNNFTWSYNGEVADSMMKDRVKAAGGKVDGDLRFSIQWNDKGGNNIDFDAHCVEPKGRHIYFSNKGQRHASSGMLDVDIVSPNGKVAVENITYSDKSKMPEGIYKFYVHNYSSSRSNAGFTAELEFGNVTHSFTYEGILKGNQNVPVVKLKYTHANGIEIIESLPSTMTSKDVWGVTTQKFQKVTMVMNSPNHWDGEETGNKHTFFILEDCLNPDSTRGFFNEYLRADLTSHRKVFEVLASKLKVEESDNQLSGLGFSSTVRNQVVVKVSGTFNRILKVNF